MVYKIDRLSRSLMDFAGIMETLDRLGVSLVSVTQQFNTTTSMGRLTLNILLSFAQFEREIISERTRDKMGAARRLERGLQRVVNAIRFRLNNGRLEGFNNLIARIIHRACGYQDQAYLFLKLR